MTRALYLVGAVAVASAVLFVITGPMGLAMLLLGLGSACVSAAWFANPALVESNVRFESPRAKRVAARAIAGLMGLIALLVVAVGIVLFLG